jgi:hypothetical protein
MVEAHLVMETQHVVFKKDEPHFNVAQVKTANSRTITCERCNKVEVVDYPENLFDFQFKYGFTFCEDCIIEWVDPRNTLLTLPDQWAARGKRK